MMDRGAIFSECRKYRYVLHRIWQPKKAGVAFVGLNPSTADANVDDPTIRRCIGYAERWGYGGIFMVNLFAYRATDPKVLKTVSDPVGQLNDIYLLANTGTGQLTICCWGSHGVYMDRAADVLCLIEDPHYLKLTKSGQPGHPLYLKKDLKPRKL